MTIKSVTTPPNPVEIRKTATTHETKTEGSSERDAQAFYDDTNQKQQKRKLTDHEIGEVIEHLKNLPFVKENNWSIRLEVVGNYSIVFVEDSQGKIIRRIPEQDLWGLWMQKSTDKNKGNILNKAL